MNTTDEKQAKTKSRQKRKKPCAFPDCGAINALKEHIRSLTETKAQLEQQLADKDARIEDLGGQIRNLKGELFAPSSERLHLIVKDEHSAETEQEAGLERPEGKPIKKKRGARPVHTGHGRKIPESLPEVVVEHVVSTESKVCPKCGAPYRDITPTEDSAEIDYEVKVIRKRHRRHKAAKTCSCEGVPVIVTAPKAIKLIPKGKFSVSFLAMAAVEKYYFQIPLHRQISQWKMMGLDVCAGTMAGCFKFLWKIVGFLCSPVACLPGFIVSQSNL